VRSLEAGFDVADAQHAGPDRIERPAPRGGVELAAACRPTKPLRPAAGSPRPERPAAPAVGRGW